MASDEGVTIGRASFERIREVVRRVEAEPAGPVVDGPNPKGRPANHQFVEVLDEPAPIVDGDTEYWPGKVTLRSDQDAAQEWTDFGDVWLTAPNAELLDIGVRYYARLVGERTLNDEEHPRAVFIVLCSIGAGMGSGSGSGPCASGIPISDLIQCTEDGLAIRDGCLSIVNGQLVLTPAAPQPPPAPENATILLDSATSVGLSWDAVPGAIDYTVEHSTDGDSWTEDDTVMTTSYTSPLFAIDGQTHRWRVRANSTAGQGDPSPVTFAAGRTTSGNLTWPDGVTTGQRHAYGQGGDGGSGTGGGGGGHSVKADTAPTGTVTVTVTAATSVAVGDITANAGATGTGGGGGGTASGGDTNTTGGNASSLTGGAGAGPLGGAGGSANTNGNPFGGGGGGTSGMAAAGLGASGAGFITGTL